MREKIKSIVALILLVLPMVSLAQVQSEIDVSWFPESGLMRIKTESGHVFLVKRTPAAIERLERSNPPVYESDFDGARNMYRSIRKDLFVSYAPCANGAELSVFSMEEGFVCSDCARYDLAGNPLNSCAGTKPIKVPRYHFKNENTLVIDR